MRILKRPALRQLLPQVTLGPLQPIRLQIGGEHGPRHVQCYDDIDTENPLFLQIHAPPRTDQRRHSHHHR